MKHSFWKKSTPKFRVGDLVLCIKDDTYNHYDFGKVYTVESVFPAEFNSIWFIRTVTNAVSSSEDHFILVDLYDSEFWRQAKEYFERRKADRLTTEGVLEKEEITQKEIWRNLK